MKYSASYRNVTPCSLNFFMISTTVSLGNLSGVLYVFGDSLLTVVIYYSWLLIPNLPQKAVKINSMK